MKYANRYHIIKQALEGLISCEQGAKALNISIRHFKRLKAKVKNFGPKALIHGNCGRKTSNAYPDEIRQQVLHLFKTRYSNFNVSHFTDMLKDEYGLSFSRETVRSRLKEAGLLKSPKHRFKRRKRRKRASKEGQIVFFDGSLHHWFADKPYTLFLALDDATGKALYALFVPRETLHGYFRLAYKVFSRYGLPQNLYLDRHSVFLTTRHEGVHVKQSADNPTSFQIAMAELEIGLIYAYSPQAKGRIERSIRTFQDRLVKELALKKITDPEKATLYTN